jgi:hypothetical protein
MTTAMTTAVAPVPTRLWTPSRVLVTRSAAERPHGRRIIDRLEAAGVSDIELLTGDRRRRPAGVQAQAAADPAVRGLALRPRRGVPGALPVLLPGRLADRAADHPGLGRPR